MVTNERIIQLFRPVAAAILEADARASALVAEGRALWSGLDHQPAAAAMASQRRALVATEMHRKIAPSAGWTLVEDNFLSGAYEWLGEGGESIRLSKTTPESRQLEAAKALQGIQSELIAPPPPPVGPSESVLIRLMGDPLRDPTVDVVCMGRKGVRTSAIPLVAIAVMQTEQVPSTTSLPAKTSVTLPGVRRIAESE